MNHTVLRCDLRRADAPPHTTHIGYWLQRCYSVSR